jgi:hypothetical protein
MLVANVEVECLPDPGDSKEAQQGSKGASQVEVNATKFIHLTASPDQLRGKDEVMTAQKQAR